MLITTLLRGMASNYLAAITKALDELEMSLRKGRWVGEYTKHMV